MDMGGPMGGPGGLPPGGPMGGPGGSPESELAAALGGPGGAPPLTEETEDSDSIVTEKHGEHADDWVRPSQKGEKDATDYPFGEDPLGDKENHAKTRPGRAIRHVFQGGSPLALESVLKSRLITSLKTYLDKAGPEKKELIREAQEDHRPSMLDESNIIDE